MEVPVTLLHLLPRLPIYIRGCVQSPAYHDSGRSHIRSSAKATATHQRALQNETTLLHKTCSAPPCCSGACPSSLYLLVAGKKLLGYMLHVCVNTFSVGLKLVIKRFLQSQHVTLQLQCDVSVSAKDRHWALRLHRGLEGERFFE